MTLAAILGSATLLSQIVGPALRALVLAGGAALALGACRVKTTSLRLLTWTSVLYAALAMPLLGWMLPAMSVPVPAFLRTTEAPSQIQASQHDDLALITTARKDKLKDKVIVQATNRSHSAEVTRQAAPVSLATSAQPNIALPTSDWRSIPWSTFAAGIYLAVALFLLTRLVVGLVFSRRLIRASQEINDHRVTTRLRSRARAAGIGMIPQAAESELISVPVTMGVLRSTILLPGNWREWDDAKLDAVIAHEVSHVARRDALTQRLSLLHRAIFWFSPLAWWLDRHLADLAEQASDEAALLCGADRADYARTLLGFFEALHAAPGRVWWQGVAMAKPGQAEKRLERILTWRGAVTMGLKKSVFIGIIALAIPVVYLAASVRPAHSNMHSQEAQTPAPPPAPKAAAAPSVAPSAPPPAADALPEPALAPDAPGPALTPAPPPDGVVSNGGRLWVRPVAPVAPIAAVGPAAPPEPWAYQSSGHGSSYSYRYDDEQRFVIVTGKSDSLTMSGSSEDARHAEKLKKQIPGDFIWFERDEKSYIIRDQATIDRARKLWAPQEDLGKKQEELGQQQEALGKQQEELGKKMEQIQIKVPDMTAELDRLKAKLQKLGPTATMEQLGDLQSEIGDMQSKIGDIQSQAGDKQSKIGEEMGALGEKQGKLGELQGELGRQQGELAEKASREMKELLDEAIKNGAAKPEADTERGPSL